MYVANVRPLLSAVAGAVNAVAALTGRVAVDRTAGSWTLTDGAYAVVRHVSGPLPALRGDAATLTRTATVEVALFELEAAEDPALAETVGVALDGTTVDGYRGRLESVVRLPDPDTDAVQHNLTVRYELVH